MNKDLYDVIIVGSGPSGLTAGIYTARANLKTLILAGRAWGGQLVLTTLVENFPGFPDGIMGPVLMQQVRKQAGNQGAEFKDVNFKSADYSKNPIEISTDSDEKFYTKTVIIATGADTKWLGVKGEKEKIGKGVSSCAPCDAAFYREKNVIVVGGGDSAMEEAEVLTKFAKHVWVVYRGDTLRASKVMQDRTFENPKITVVWNTVIEEIEGQLKVEKVKLLTTTNEGGVVTRENNKDKSSTVAEFGGVEVSNVDGGLRWEMPIDGIFVAIGHIPNSAVFQGIDRDEKGFIKVYNHTKTNIDRVYVAGDVHDAEYKQAVTAAGFGCMAALEVDKYLRENKV